MLHFRWTNRSCTLDMLIDKKSKGFKNIEEKLANEVKLLFLSRRLLDYLLYALAYRCFLNDYIKSSSLALNMVEIVSLL